MKLLNEVLLNIYSNLIPNQVKTIKPRQAPRITQAVKTFLKKKNHAYTKFVRNGEPGVKLEGLQKMISDGTKLIKDAKKNYLHKTLVLEKEPGLEGRQSSKGSSIVLWMKVVKLRRPNAQRYCSSILG